MGINPSIPLPSVTYASPREVMLIPGDLSITLFLQPFYKDQLMKRIIIIISIFNLCNNNFFGQENRAGWKLIRNIIMNITKALSHMEVATQL